MQDYRISIGDSFHLGMWVFEIEDIADRTAFCRAGNILMQIPLDMLRVYMYDERAE